MARPEMVRPRLDRTVNRIDPNFLLALFGFCLYHPKSIYSFTFLEAPVASVEPLSVLASVVSGPVEGLLSFLVWNVAWGKPIRPLARLP
jgi:hypothetical protein